MASSEKKKSLLNDFKHNKLESTNQIDNTLFEEDQILKDLPNTSIRLQVATLNKINAIKNVIIFETLDDIINEAIDKYIETYNTNKQSEIESERQRLNEFKIRQAIRKKNKS
jgi:hypothetical protein